MARVCGTSRNLKAVVALGAMLGGCTGGPGEDRSALSATASVPGVAAVPQAASVRRSYAQATGPEWSGNPVAPVTR